MAVIIVDYGAGNIANVMKALKYCGLSARLSDDPQEISKAQGLIVPGVGAFSTAMDRLQAKGLVQPIQAYAQAGKPLLGICLGMQLLFDESDEFGQRAGLGLIPGKIIPLPTETGCKVPQMGWNDNQVHQNRTLTQGLNQQATYFVHSYYAKTDPKYIAASVNFGELVVPSVVCQDNVMGTQFHPEKSGLVGLAVLKNFKEMVDNYDFSSN